MIIPVTLFTYYFLLLHKKRIPHSGMLITFFILVLIVTFKPIDMRDYLSYIYEYENLSSIILRSEPGYVFLERLFNFFQLPYIVFFIFVAIVSVGLKIYVIDKLSCYVSLSLAIYICNFFILQDMIALRAALAAGILLCAVKHKIDSDNRKYLILVTLAVLFHYSSAVFYLLFFLNKERPRVFLFSLILLSSVVIGTMGLGFSSIFNVLNIDAVKTLMAIHADDAEESPLNIFNGICLIRLFIVSFSLYYIFKYEIKDEQLILFTKMYVISLLLWFIFSDINALSTRSSELIQVIEVLYLPRLIVLLPKRLKTLGYLGAVVLCTLFLYNNIINVGLLL